MSDRTGKALSFLFDVFLAGVASWGAGKVEGKLEEYLGSQESEEEQMLSSEAHIVITCGMDIISEKFAEYVRAKDNLEKETEKQKFGRAKHIAYHVSCARRDLDMLILDLIVAPDTSITEEFLDGA